MVCWPSPGSSQPFGGGEVVVDDLRGVLAADSLFGTTRIGTLFGSGSCGMAVLSFKPSGLDTLGSFAPWWR